MAETSKTADHALRVLLELSNGGSMSPAELARRLELNRTVVHRLLTTLHQRGFVTRNENGYLPGATLVRIARGVQPELRAAAAGVMPDLARAVGETVVLHIPDADDAVVLDQCVATWHVLRVEHEIGSRHSLVLGASGRAMLAFLPSETIARLVGGHDDPAWLERQLAQIRDLGYAVSHDELQNGVHGVAVPVLLDRDQAIASLAIICPATRASRIAEGVEALREGASAIAAALDRAAPLSSAAAAG